MRSLCAGPNAEQCLRECVPRLLTCSQRDWTSRRSVQRSGPARTISSDFCPATRDAGVLLERERRHPDVGEEDPELDRQVRRLLPSGSAWTTTMSDRGSGRGRRLPIAADHNRWALVEDPHAVRDKGDVLVAGPCGELLKGDAVEHKDQARGRRVTVRSSVEERLDLVARRGWSIGSF